MKQLDLNAHENALRSAEAAHNDDVLPPGYQPKAPREFYGDTRPSPAASYQERVLNWMKHCFPIEVCRDGDERNHRFLEESLELVQSLGCTKAEAHQLVDYVFGRPVGEPEQELGGVMVTLAALCFPHELNMRDAGERELSRVWTMVEKIRAKQAAKPKFSPLPEAPAAIKSPLEIFNGMAFPAPANPSPANCPYIECPSPFVCARGCKADRTERAIDSKLVARVEPSACPEGLVSRPCVWPDCMCDVGGGP